MHKIESSFEIDFPLAEVWEFFSNPANLEKLTPSDMAMKPAGDLPKKMYEGLVVSYKVKPLAGITLTWSSLISTVVEKEYFIDQQVQGPFSYWHHEHHFKETARGTLLTDILHYRVPGAIFGKLFNKLIVKHKLEKLFNQRQALTEKALSNKPK